MRVACHLEVMVWINAPLQWFRPRATSALEALRFDGGIAVVCCVQEEVSRKRIVSSPFGELGLGVWWWVSWHLSVVCEWWAGFDDSSVLGWSTKYFLRWAAGRIKLGECAGVGCWVRGD